MWLYIISNEQIYLTLLTLLTLVKFSVFKIGVTSLNHISNLIVTSNQNHWIILIYWIFRWC